MGRPKKYHTEEEIKAARKSYQDRYRKLNTEKYNKYQKEYQKENAEKYKEKYKASGKYKEYQKKNITKKINNCL